MNVTTAGMIPPRPNSLMIPINTTSSSSIMTPSSVLNLPTPSLAPMLTPNTLKSFEQSILQQLGEDEHEHFTEPLGNFVPPLPSSTSTITLINTWQGGQVSSDIVKQEEAEPESVAIPPEPEKQVKKRPARGKGGGGKQPKKQKQASQTRERTTRKRDTEEDERRKIRRERNKLAAARCRKRRVDKTNQLVEQTEGLESRKRNLQNQITELQSQKEELEFLLHAHNCVKKFIKSDILADLQNIPKQEPSLKMKRPSSLNVANTIGHERTTTPASISTPSNGIAGLGFEPLCSDWPVNTPTEDKLGIVPNEILHKVHSPLVTPVLPFKKLQDL